MGRWFVLVRAQGWALGAGRLSPALLLDNEPPAASVYPVSFKIFRMLAKISPGLRGGRNDCSPPFAALLTCVPV